MDRLIAYDRQVLVFGKYGKEGEQDSKRPLLEEVLVTNLGPGTAYVRAFTARDSQGVIEAPSDLWVEPGESKTLFKMDMLGALERTIAGAPDASIRFRNALRVENAFRMGCRVITHHGDHHLQWAVEMRAEMKVFRAEPDLPSGE